VLPYGILVAVVVLHIWPWILGGAAWTTVSHRQRVEHICELGIPESSNESFARERRCTKNPTVTS